MKCDCYSISKHLILKTEKKIYIKLKNDRVFFYFYFVCVLHTDFFVHYTLVDSWLPESSKMEEEWVFQDFKFSLQPWCSMPFSVSGKQQFVWFFLCTLHKNTAHYSSTKYEVQFAYMMNGLRLARLMQSYIRFSCKHMTF